MIICSAQHTIHYSIREQCYNLQSDIVGVTPEIQKQNTNNTNH